MKINITEKDAAKRTFDPISIEVKLQIDSQEELDNLILEFTEGEFTEYSTQYSVVLFKYIDELQTFIKNRS